MAAFAQDITLKGLEAVRKCSEVYLEAYTSVLTVPKERLEAAWGVTITIADRDFVESHIEPARTEGLDRGSWRSSMSGAARIPSAGAATCYDGGHCVAGRWRPIWRHNALRLACQSSTGSTPSAPEGGRPGALRQAEHMLSLLPSLVPAAACADKRGPQRFDHERHRVLRAPALQASFARAVWMWFRAICGADSGAVHFSVRGASMHRTLLPSP